MIAYGCKESCQQSQKEKNATQCWIVWKWDHCPGHWGSMRLHAQSLRWCWDGCAFWLLLDGIEEFAAPLFLAIELPDVVKVFFFEAGFAFMLWSPWWCKWLAVGNHLIAHWIMNHRFPFLCFSRYAAVASQDMETVQTLYKFLKQPIVQPLLTFAHGHLY